MRAFAYCIAGVVIGWSLVSPWSDRLEQAVALRADVEAPEREPDFVWPAGFERSRQERTVTTYRIGGQDPAQVWAEIRRHGPYDEQRQRRFAGYARWKISWHARFETDQAGCRLGEVRVVTTTAITLPDWAEGHRARGEHREAWDRFLAALSEHEHGHAEVAEAGGERIERTLSGLPAAASCEEALEAGRREGDRLIAEVRLEQERFDRETAHGVRTGAHFP